MTRRLVLDDGPPDSRVETACYACPFVRERRLVEAKRLRCPGLEEQPEMMAKIRLCSSLTGRLNRPARQFASRGVQFSIRGHLWHCPPGGKLHIRDPPVLASCEYLERADRDERKRLQTPSKRTPSDRAGRGHFRGGLLV